MNYNVKDFGAKGDHHTLDQVAIQAAIDCCWLEGGGTIRIPAGTYCCGTIRLRSNICLFLESGATISGVNDSKLYPVIAPTPFGNLPGQIQGLLWGEEVENVTIAGPGIIDGGGSEPLSGKEAETVKFRPALVFFRNSRNINLQDVTLRNSCFWTLHLLRSKDVKIRGINIQANQNRINTDGIDPDGCSNVIISDCHIVTGDDCIVIKSTEGDPCENITVTNCVLSSAQAALKLGTESRGDIRNITFTNCVVYQSGAGIALYMKDGGVYENILFCNLVIKAVNEFPILIDITPRYYRDPHIGKIRNVRLDNLIINGKGRCLVEGTTNAPVTNLSFTNITWDIDGICDPPHEKKPSGGKRVELDPNRINYVVHPYHFMIIKVQGLQMKNIRLAGSKIKAISDRGFVYLQNITDGFIENVNFESQEKKNMIQIVDCKEINQIC